MSCFVIGVDVGGTNTDAVILKDREVISSFKHPTTPDPIHGIVNAIQGCLNHTKDDPEIVKANLTRVCIGTTHFVNAVVERSRDNLVPVAVVRLCGPASLAVPPFADFPRDLKSLIKSKVYMVSGGLEYNGKNISTLKQDEIKDIAKELLSAKPSIKHVVVSGVFSPLDNPDKNQEKIVADTLLSVSKEFSITQASWIGRLGILERENAAILNESLRSLAMKTVTSFQKALKDLQLDCPLYLTQNDGTLIDIDEAMKNPILTFSSGPTNSMRGAMFLSGRTDALVIDIGGTTTDIGVVCNGFPREASSQVKIGGVRTNFQMPDIVSIGLGGGSKVIINEDSSVEVGPESVGYELIQKAQCFGGEVLTATDIAITVGITDLKGTSSSSINATCAIAYKVMREIRNKIETLIDMVKTDKKDVPVIVVGGGAILIDTSLPLKGASCMIFPPNYTVANAVGAALGTVAGRSERAESLREVIESLKSKYSDLTEDELRNKAIESLIQKGIEIATEAARKKGCIVGSEILHEKNVIPITYVPDALKVSIKVIGQLSEGSEIKNQSETNKETNIEKTATNIEVTSTMKDNPFWPFSSEEDKLKDELAGLPTPLINSITGEWVLSACDIECISIGAGILGCGGGGDPNVGRVIALLLQEQGKEIKIMNPWRINKSTFGLAAGVAFMGAPVVVGEKLCSGNESKKCLNVIQNILATGVCEEFSDYGRKETEGVTLTTRDVSSRNKIWLPDVSKLPNIELNSDTIPLNRRISGLICLEIGGMNSFEPLVTAAKVGLPILDADGMGRAFPELQMFLPYINGVKAYPSCVADEKGDVVAVTHVKSAKDLEEFFRTECVRMGMSCGICSAPMSLEDVLSNCVLLSYSQAWQLGRVILRIRAVGGMTVVDAVAEQQKGTVLLIGKITDVYKDTSQGFTTSTVTVEGLRKYSGESISIVIKNENLLAQRLNADGTKGDVLAVTPDLITIIDSDSGYPITTDDVNYGLRVAVLALPAYHGFTTPQSLQFVGPKAFGFDIEYQQILNSKHQ